VKYNVDKTNSKAVFANGIGIIDDYMASENLNECVDALLVRKSKAAFEQHAAALESAKKQAAEKKGSSSAAFKTITDASKQNEIPTVVIRHRAKGCKQAQKRLRKNRV